MIRRHALQTAALALTRSGLAALEQRKTQVFLRNLHSFAACRMIRRHALQTAALALRVS
jgi:hypothetical protein